MVRLQGIAGPMAILRIVGQAPRANRLHEEKFSLVLGERHKRRMIPTARIRDMLPCRAHARPVNIRRASW